MRTFPLMRTSPLSSPQNHMGANVALQRTLTITLGEHGLSAPLPPQAAAVKLAQTAYTCLRSSGGEGSGVGGQSSHPCAKQPPTPTPSPPPRYASRGGGNPSALHPSQQNRWLQRMAHPLHHNRRLLRLLLPAPL